MASVRWASGGPVGQVPLCKRGTACMAAIVVADPGWGLADWVLVRLCLGAVSRWRSQLVNVHCAGSVEPGHWRRHVAVYEASEPALLPLLHAA